MTANNHGLYTDTSWAVSLVFENDDGAAPDLSGFHYVMDVLLGTTVVFRFKSNSPGATDGTIGLASAALGQLDFTASPAAHALVPAGTFRVHLKRDLSDDIWYATGRMKVGKPGERTTYLTIERTTASGTAPLSAALAVPFSLLTGAAGDNASLAAALALKVGTGTTETGFWTDRINAALAIASWHPATVFAAAAQCTYGPYIYVTTAGGTTGPTAPVHSSGTTSDGGVSWTYVGLAYSTAAATAQIWKIRNRVAIGDAADMTGTFDEPQGSWMGASASAANWISRISQLLVQSSNGGIGITGASRASDYSAPTGTGAAIGVAGYVICDTAIQGRAFYGDVQFQGYGAAVGYGLELAVKNKSSSSIGTTAHLQSFNTCGIWMAAGGDDSYGGAAVNPSSVGIAIGSNEPGDAAHQWNCGIAFFTGSLANNPSTGYPVAISMASGHRLHWGMTGNFTGASIYSDVSTDGQGTVLRFGNNAVYFGNGSGLSSLVIAHVASGVNGVSITQSIAGVSPLISAFGSDTDLDLKLRGKGTGSVLLQSSAAATKIGINAIGIGFFGATPAAKPTITGSRGGNAAVASMLTEFATLGLCIDGTS